MSSATRATPARTRGANQRRLPTRAGLPRGLVPVRLLRSAPLTCSVVLLVLLASLLLRTHPDHLDDVVAWSSTNIDNLARHPVGSLVASAFVVPGGVLPELALAAGGLLILERAIGTRSTLAVAAAGHVVATVLTEYGAELAGRLHLIATAPDRPDVGISYLMFAVLGGAIVLRSGALRLLGSLTLAASVVVPFLLAPGLTTTGHLLSLGIGAGLICWLRTRRAGQRPRTDGQVLELRQPRQAGPESEPDPEADRTPRQGRKPEGGTEVSVEPGRAGRCP